MAIVNMTPHAIVIFASEDAKFNKDQRKLLLREGAVGRPVPPSGELLNAQLGSESGEPIDGIPTKRSVVLGADSIPPGDDFYVVSRLYLAAAQSQGWDCSRLLTIADPVYDGVIPQPKGCLGFERN
jgi:hypothetical protein